MEDLSKFETDLWAAADNLRANSKLTSSDYFMPVLGIIFLRHAANRFDAATKQIEADQAAGRMPKRKVLPADYIRRRALFLPEPARFDSIMARATNDRAGLPALVTEAMTAIEADFEPLKNVLPKDYGIFEPKVLEELMRLFNSEQIKHATGDVFGRIYEYFLAKFSIQKAHDNGEFFTPSSLVQLIVNVIEPDHGNVFDPACGSGGMFVQSSHFIEQDGGDTTKKVVFYGQEKNRDTIRIAKMNLAVHGLEGKIAEAITYYQDEHNLGPKEKLAPGSCDFVMANPPFNVDLVDADRIKKDPRLPFGLPGVNKDKRVSNGNYLWISYFWSYLSEKGRAGFVMSSQASSAGNDEKIVRQKLVETGDVDVMISIRGGFFYTRTVPCELWHFDRSKPEERKDQVLMLDARNIGQLMKGSRKVYEFTLEQMRNLTAIVWLYRGQRGRFFRLLIDYRKQCALRLAQFHQALRSLEVGALQTDVDYLLACVHKVIQGYLAPETPQEKVDALTAAHRSARERLNRLREEVAALAGTLEAHGESFEDGAADPYMDADEALGRVKASVSRLDVLTQETHALARSAQASWKELDVALGQAETLLSSELRSEWRKEWRVRPRQQALAPAFEEVASTECELRYFQRQLHWLLHRFPEAHFVAIPGLCRVVTRADIAASDWSLTPSRYVGVAPAEVDEDFNFEQAIGDISVELATLNAEAAELAETIQSNLESLRA